MTMLMSAWCIAKAIVVQTHDKTYNAAERKRKLLRLNAGDVKYTITQSAELSTSGPRSKGDYSASHMRLEKEKKA